MTWDFPNDLPEAAWGIIANAWNGNWDEAPREWREAAIRWRDAYHETLREHEGVAGPLAHTEDDIDTIRTARDQDTINPTRGRL